MCEVGYWWERISISADHEQVAIGMDGSVHSLPDHINYEWHARVSGDTALYTRYEGQGSMQEQQLKACVIAR